MTATARVLALQRAAGNRAATRMLLRDPKKPASPPAPRVPKTYQVADRDLPRVAADPELAQRALEFRVDNGMLTPEAFGQNVAVVKYARDGQIGYLVRANDPGKLHSEVEAIKELERLDPLWQRTEILEVYTERHPCASCWPSLKAVRARIKKIRAGKGERVADFRTYYSVPKDEPGATRAAELGEQYFSGGPPRAPGTEVTGTGQSPAAPAGGTGSEPAPEVGEKPTGGSKAGRAVGGVLFAVAPYVLGYLHEHGRASRVEERAKEQGYVPQGDRGGLLDRVGDLLFDPLGEGERSVPISARVNMAKWRQTARDWFGGHTPGDTVVYHWDYYRDSRDMYSRWFVYMLGVDGRWFIFAEGVDREGAYNFMRDLSSAARDFFSKHPSAYTVKPSSEIPPDINDVISPSVPDSAVERQMVYDETIV